MVDCCLWGWFSRIPLVSLCSEARVTADGMVTARCAVAVDAGTTVEILTPGASAPPVVAVVTRIADRFTMDLAEGLIEKLDPNELKDLQDVELDEHGHIRFAEVNLGRKIKVEIEGRFRQREIRLKVSNKNVGYELRCCDPIPFDMAYCRELGNAAIRFLLNGGSGAMVSVQNGTLVPMLLADFRDPQTGKIRVRNVDINSESYRAARQYMLRLDYTDFERASWTKKLAQAANLSVDELKARFS